MKKCLSCGDLLKIENKFCPKCGTKIDTSYLLTSSESNYVDKKPVNEVPSDFLANNKLGLLGLGLLMVIGILLNMSTKNSTATPGEGNGVSSSSGKIRYSQGISYIFNRNNCQPSESWQCISVNDYQNLCKQAKLSNTAGLQLVIGDTVARALLDGGSVDEVGVRWIDSSKQCQGFITVSGIYRGNSARRSYSGEIYEFKVNEANTIVATSLYMTR